MPSPEAGEQPLREGSPSYLPLSSPGLISPQHLLPVAKGRDVEMLFQQQPSALPSALLSAPQIAANGLT